MAAAAWASSSDVVAQTAEATNTDVPSTNEQQPDFAELARTLAIGSRPNATPSEVKAAATAVVAVRQLLTSLQFDHSSKIVDSGMLRSLVDLLDVPDPEMQYNALWCVTNISSGTAAHATSLLSFGVIPKLVRFLVAPDLRLRAQAAWCLGNFAGDGSGPRDQILNAGVLPPLLKCINDQAEAQQLPNSESDSTIRNATWLLAQLCRNKPSPPMEVLEPCIPTIRKLFSHPVVEIQDDACWAVSYLTDGPRERIATVEKYDVFDTILNFLRSQRPTVLLPAVRTFGNFAVLGDTYSQALINQGVLDCLRPTLQPRISRQVRKEVCWVLSNICAGTPQECRAVMDAGLFPLIIQNISNASEFEVRKEATWAMANALKTADPVVVKYLIQDTDAAKALATVLATHAVQITHVALEALEVILQAGEAQKSSSEDKTNPYALMLERDGSVNNIAVLMDNADQNTSGLACVLMEDYFAHLLPNGGEDEENEEIGGDKERDLDKLGDFSI